MSEPFNKLTPRQAERLALLAEECGETIQAIGKILRHGFDSAHPITKQSNRSALESEIGHIQVAVLLIERARDIDPIQVRAAQNRKFTRIEEYLHHLGDEK